MKARPFAAEVIATVFWYGWSVFFAFDFSLWTTHGAWHVMALLSCMAAGWVGWFHGAAAWRMFRDGTPGAT